jgi:hypothetical protein
MLSLGSGLDAVRVHRQVTPACHALEADRNDRQFGNLHRPQLPVASAQQGLRLLVLPPTGQNLSPSAQHHPAKQGPVVVVSIGHDGNHRVALDVADPLERRPRGSLWLFVDGDVERAMRNRKTHRHHMRDRVAVDRGEMPDPSGGQKPAFALREHLSPPRASPMTSTRITAPCRTPWPSQTAGSTGRGSFLKRPRGRQVQADPIPPSARRGFHLKVTELPRCCPEMRRLPGGGRVWAAASGSRYRPLTIRTQSPTPRAGRTIEV